MVTQTPVIETAATAERDDGPSLNAVVYKTIKNRILSSRLRPGNKLGHQEVAESLGVSRTPVREALERLQQEGFVVRRPRRGYFVAEIEAGEARELYEMREALETYALRRAAVLGLTRAKIRELEAILKKYGELVRDNVMRERLVVDRDFHLALGAIPGNRVLSNALEAVYERIVLKIRTEGFRTTRGEKGYEEHVALFNALKHEDFRRAEQMLSAHIREGCKRLLAHLEEAAKDQSGVISPEFKRRR